MKKITAAVLAIMIILSQAAVFSAPKKENNKEESVQTENNSTEQNAEAPADNEENAEEETEDDSTFFPEPRAKGSVLFDMKGERIIFESNADEKMYPASLTKIMTALLVLEKGNLTETVTVNETALADITYLHSKIGLKVGEQMTVENLLVATLVSSANDAANVLAEYISGTVPDFVNLMNTRAAELGMTNTHFVTPHGFHDDNHYSSPRDLMKVTLEALKNQKFCEIVKIKTIKLPATNMSSERTVASTNHLISRYRNTFHYYPYATGVKTGSTDEAGSCLIASAEKDGISLLSIVMGCNNQDDKENAYSFVDTKAMFEYVFNNYKNVMLASVNDVVADSDVYEAKDGLRVAMSPTKDINVLLPNDYKPEEISGDAKLAENIKAPIKKGDVLATVTYSFRGETIATCDLVAANDVKRDFWKHVLHGIKNFLLNPFVLFPILIIAVIWIVSYRKRNRTKNVRRKYMKSRKNMPPNRYSKNSVTPNRNPNRSAVNRSTSSRKQYSKRNSVEEKPYDPWDKYR